VPWIDREAYLRVVRGETRGLRGVLARRALGGIAAGYAVAVGMRNALYDSGLWSAQRVGVPVVSVGNLTLGGTGKTPMVEWLARWYRDRGVRVALISRGYGSRREINDEGRVLEENLPDVPHLQDPDRVASGWIAVRELESQLIILDDGFQHRRLARDLDMVLLDSLDPFGQGRLFPRGLLREPVGSLRRAGVVMLTRADLVDRSRREEIWSLIERVTGSGVRLESRHAPVELIDAEGGRFPLSELFARDVAAFCGIGNPDGFRRTIAPLCGRVLDFRVFPDHHPYNRADVRGLAAWARELRPNLVLTTQKDLVKLRALSLGGVPLRGLRIGLEITVGLQALEELLEPLVPANPPVETS